MKIRLLAIVTATALLSAAGFGQTTQENYTIEPPESGQEVLINLPVDTGKASTKPAPKPEPKPDLAKTIPHKPRKGPKVAVGSKELPRNVKRKLYKRQALIDSNPNLTRSELAQIDRMIDDELKQYGTCLREIFTELYASDQLQWKGIVKINREQQETRRIVNGHTEDIAQNTEDITMMKEALKKKGILGDPPVTEVEDADPKQEDDTGFDPPAQPGPSKEKPEQKVKPDVPQKSFWDNLKLPGAAATLLTFSVIGWREHKKRKHP